MFPIIPFFSVLFSSLFDPGPCSGRRPKPENIPSNMGLEIEYGVQEQMVALQAVFRMKLVKPLARR